MRFGEGEGQKIKVILNILVCAIALYRVSTRDFEKQETSAFENIMIDFFAPMQKSVTFVHNSFNSVFDNYIANVNASKENAKLQMVMSDLKSQIFSYKEMELENIRLKGLLDFGEDLPYKKVLAQVVARDASSDFRVLRINKGLSDGLKLQATVVTGSGLVGFVYRLTDHFADVLTILDPNNRVDSLVKRIRAHGIIEGDSDLRCLMKYVNRTEPIILNDEVLTSGLGNLYPKGILIGKVSKIERQSYGMTQEIEISPVVNFGKLEEVIVLVSEGDKKKDLEWEALDSNAEEKNK
ncbi:rod shape-determining protein MreC [Halobacteriovorax sp. HLS]|uniref:rod shape-determining protein MreC n=1 Tax=Halobacteriovorax sp. HLS TaxID=2234000 RepID=UPI0013E3ED3A|nr:rod shape-determining protein MreC [Halobacteriovorax sp. HLS]